MEGSQIAGDDGLAGMSKNQLYHIMQQMKTLIEQNKEQAKQILVQNPEMTRALFQAQIMLGMVQPPQAPTTPQTTSNSSSQPSADQQSNVRATPTGQKQRKLSLQKLQQPKNKPAKPLPQSSQVPSIAHGPQIQYTASQITSASHQPQHTLQNIGSSHHMPSFQPHLPQEPKPSLPKMSSINQPPRPQQPVAVTPELEKALLQQVMSLTPEQINMLPPDQRNQILQLQQALRQ